MKDNIHIDSDIRFEHNREFLGRMLKYARENQKLTQQEAADKLYLSLSHYKDLELGNANPSLPSLYSILQFYNLSADSLLQPKLDDKNNNYNQIIRLLGRCTDSELQLILSLVTDVMSHTDAIENARNEKTLEEIYTQAFIDTMGKHKSNRTE